MGIKFPEKKCYVTLKWPPPNQTGTILFPKGMTGSAKWLPVSMPTGVSRCEIATQTCGLFYPSEREIQKKKREEEEKVAVEKQMRDRNPLLTAVSPGRGTSIQIKSSLFIHRIFRNNSGVFTV